MANVTIFLYAETTRFAPRERLVIPEAARVETNIDPDCAHVANEWRSNRLGGFGLNRIIFIQDGRVFDLVQGDQRADFNPLFALADAFEFLYSAKIYNMRRFEKLLPHRWKQ